MSEPLLGVKELRKLFPVTRGVVSRKTLGYVHAVDGTSFSIDRKKTLSLVGESGSGKTTIGKLIIRLLEPTSGEIHFDGQNISHASKKELRRARRKMGMIFQDPFSSLDPRKTIASIIGEPLLIQGIPKHQRNNGVLELIEQVGLNSEHINRYPHEFSGGQRQRIAIARALALNPSLVIADEPVSALDVSVQAQIINLMRDLQNDSDLSYLFISHDLSVVKHISDEVAVMYLGKILEKADKDLFSNPKHPYTQALLSAVPIPNPHLMANRERIRLKGGVPSPLNPPSGCRFHPRCIYARPKCSEEEPELLEINEKHHVACHLFGHL